LLRPFFPKFTEVPGETVLDVRIGSWVTACKMPICRHLERISRTPQPMFQIDFELLEKSHAGSCIAPFKFFWALRFLGPEPVK
jgi:hypothetical protein